MEMKLSEAEIHAALDYWLRGTHPTVMDGKQISVMTLATYPTSINLSITPPPEPETPPATQESK